MKEAHSPLLFWYYCIDRGASINNLTEKIRFILHGTNDHTLLMGDQGDISKI